MFYLLPCSLLSSYKLDLCGVRLYVLSKRLVNFKLLYNQTSTASCICFTSEMCSHRCWLSNLCCSSFPPRSCLHNFVLQHKRQNGAKAVICQVGELIQLGTMGRVLCPRRRTDTARCQGAIPLLACHKAPREIICLS